MPEKMRNKSLSLDWWQSPNADQYGQFTSIYITITILLYYYITKLLYYYITILLYYYYFTIISIILSISHENIENSYINLPSREHGSYDLICARQENCRF